METNLDRRHLNLISTNNFKNCYLILIFVWHYSKADFNNRGVKLKSWYLQILGKLSIFFLNTYFVINLPFETAVIHSQIRCCFDREVI